MLRPAGVINRKEGCEPRPVQIVHEGGPRYALADFEPYLGAEDYELRQTTHVDKNEDERADLDEVMAGCAWLRHTRDEAATLSEPIWFAGMSIVANCRNGKDVAHDYSKPYPRYCQVETTKKAEAARESDKPCTCSRIVNDYGGARFCRACPNRGKITSPIELGYPMVTVTALTVASNGYKQLGKHHIDAKKDQSGATPWPELRPLAPPAPVPSLDAELVPEAFRAWLTDIADLACTPVEMIAAPALVGLGAVVGRSIGIRPWPFNDYLTVPNIWGAVVARPGWMKSSAVGEGLKPILRLAATAREDYEARKDSADAKIAAMESVLEDLKRRMKDAAKRDEPLDELEEHYAAKKRELRELKVTERRYLTHDATVEKLGELLRENPRGMLVVRDELYGLLRSFERTGRENDRQFYLEAWDGTGSFTSDRINRGTIHIAALTVSIVGSIQPGRLRALIDEATAGGGSDDGLMQRFQMTVWPDQLAAWKQPDRWPDSGARSRAFSVFHELDTTAPHELRAKRNRDGEIPYLTFSPAAQGIADAWRNALEERLRPGGDLETSAAFASHIAKYRSLMPSLALLFHLINVADGSANPGPVLEDSARLAVEWCTFLEAHARKLYDVELDRGKSAARSLAAKIEAGALIDGETVRDIYRRGWSGLKSDEVVIDGLTVLESLGWIRFEPVTTGGRSTQVIRLHPELITRARAA